MKYRYSLFLSLFTLLGLTACLDQIKLSQYSIEYPVNEGVYVGTEYEASPNNLPGFEKLGKTFVVNYDKAPSTQLKMVLNGNDVGEYFVQGATQATADIQQIKQFFRQGRNTFSVEPLSLGPQIVFNLDIEGPTIILTESNYSYVQDGVDADGEPKMAPDSVRVHGYLRDASNYGTSLTVELTQVAGNDPSGNVITIPMGSEEITVKEDGSFVGNISIANIIEPEKWNNSGSNEFPVWTYIPGKSLLYTIRVSDEHGYASSMNIMADVAGSNDSMPISNAVRLAIGDSFIESLRPVIAAGIANQLEKEPISGSNLGPFKVDIGLGNMPTTVDYFHLASGKEASADYEPPEDSPAKVNWTDINDGNGPGKATVLLNGFKVKRGSVLGVDLIITNVLAELTIELPSWISWLISELSLGMFIARVDVETDAIVQAAEGKVDVQLGESNIALQGIQTTEVKAGALDVTALAGALIPLLEGLIGDLLPTILNPVISDNLSRIVIGQRLYRSDLIPQAIKDKGLPKPDATDLTDEEKSTLAWLENNVPYTDFRVDVFELGTATVLEPTYDLTVGIQSKADTGKADRFVKPILGTYFSDDPINPNLVQNGLGNTGTNISMAINSNLINQFLAGLYSIGQMHLTLYKDTTYFGADYALTPIDPDDNSKTLASKNDTRIRLWPAMPPIFAMEEIPGSGGTGKASITYPSATLAMETYDGNQWNVDIELEVDFDLAILVDELDGAVTLGAAGPPVFNINNVKNNTNIQVPEIVIRKVIDGALFFGGDILSNQTIPINLNDIASTVINGTQVSFLDADDNFTLANAEGENPGECAIEYEEGQWGKCPIGDLSCDPSDNPLTIGSGGDGADTICQSLNFVVQTDTVGTIGDRGSNLFFQMGARDPNIPAPPALPRLDLDDDGVVDYRDNCSINQVQLSSIIKNIADSTGETLENNYLDRETGELNPSYKLLIRDAANKLLATVYGGSDAAVPTDEDIEWYNTNMRVADNPVTDLGSYPWLALLFSNTSQFDSDKDRIGELCEDDRDRDGIYADNLSVTQADNCPSVFNPGQTDTYYPVGVGDACNARSAFVMLRSYKSKIDDPDDNPLCLAQPEVISGDMTNVRDMLPCDPNDPRQRFYMKAVNGVDLSEGVEFYSSDSRDQLSVSRLSAYGRQERSLSGGCASSGTKTIVQDLRMYNRNNSALESMNATGFDSIWDCAGSGPYPRVDPIWFPRRATLNKTDSLVEAQYPWYIDTRFNYKFSFYNEGVSPLGTCISYSSGFGVDVNSVEDDSNYCKDGTNWRWAIWVGGADAPWNGEW